MAKKQKTEQLLQIIALAGEYVERPISPMKGRAIILADFVTTLAKGTRYEGDAKEIIEILGFHEHQADKREIYVP